MDGRVMCASQRKVPPAFGFRERQADGACPKSMPVPDTSDCTDQLLAAWSLDFGEGRAGSVRSKRTIPPGID